MSELRKVSEIRACEDCLACYTSDLGGIHCNADGGPGALTNGQLSRRHPDCPMVGKARTWPKGGR